jgi:transporter family protein
VASRQLTVPAWVVLGLLSAIFAALVAVFAKIGLKDVDPVAATAARSVILTVVVLLAAFGSGRISGVQDITGGGWIWIALSGIAGAASYLAYFAALQLGQASAISALDRLSVVFVVVLSAIFLGEGFSAAKLLGSGLVVGGVYLISR